MAIVIYENVISKIAITNVEVVIMTTLWLDIPQTLVAQSYKQLQFWLQNEARLCFIHLKFAYFFVRFVGWHQWRTPGTRTPYTRSNQMK